MDALHYLFKCEESVPQRIYSTFSNYGWFLPRFLAPPAPALDWLDQRHFGPRLPVLAKGFIETRVSASSPVDEVFCGHVHVKEDEGTSGLCDWLPAPNAVALDTALVCGVQPALQATFPSAMRTR